MPSLLKSSISIVTINLNNAVGLKKTITSVLNQTAKPHEFIIVDGGSTDGSIGIINEQTENNLKWISEPDTGIYNAQNKGLRQATGDYVLFLNSGDELINKEILEKVIPLLNGTDIVYGDLLIVELSTEWVKKYNDPLSFGYFLGDTLPHQGSFIKRSVFDSVGRFDETLRICSDWKFFLNAVCRFNCSILYLDFVVTRYDFSGISSDPVSKKRMADEKDTVLIKDFPRFYKEYKELFELRGKYPLLANSRAVKFYFKIRNIFIRDN